jgi:hypothetical protein
MDMLCFIYINSRSIRAGIKQTDQEEALLRELMADLLLNQEDDLVKSDIASEGDDEADWIDREALFDDILATE